MVCNPHSTEKLEKHAVLKKKEMLQSCTILKKQCSALKFYSTAKIGNSFFKTLCFGQVKDFKKIVITEVLKLNQDKPSFSCNLGR